ncbi:putative NADH dehydrogenase [Fictibacillus macauensis ZFHKF-1]|uniref:Putative NADH dehydrogenase n=1 Tax=Fictibacillus macauensis ZFHKF-1 TaxID=1196324 RepID=I8AJG0_9BACL|nr:NAD(P)/FAD-dependent oxidoreductase [Fictibacillus macauensis]EIT85649.1 putative NADH dehydrogenase [Fictibacillus macauensis ZFHKF-1]
MKHLVLLGGGYGGMRLMKRLLNASDLPSDVQITLIDKNPYHCLKTEYYALAAGTISDHHIRVPFPEHPQLHIKYGEITGMNLETKEIHLLDEEPISFDELVIGLGCEDKYHNVPGAAEFTHSIQSIDNSRDTYQTLNNLPHNGVVSVVGAGLSGVELASELHESRPDLKIKLFDRGPIILNGFKPRLSNYVQNWFIQRGVEVINNSNITRVEEGILYNHDTAIPSDAIVWTAGIQPNKLVRDLDVEKDPQGRVILANYHHLPENEHVFVVGDCASMPFSPSAQLAEEQAEHIAKVLLCRWKDEPMPKLDEIKLKGVMGSLGKKSGFGTMGSASLIGRVPRLLKSGILWLYKYQN